MVAERGRKWSVTVGSRVSDKQVSSIKIETEEFGLGAMKVYNRQLRREKRSFTRWMIDDGMGLTTEDNGVDLCNRIPENEMVVGECNP